jgi:hypothetical protein
MRKSSLFLGLSLIFLNILAGSIFSFYPIFNCILSSFMIGINLVLIQLMYKSYIKDGFKISLSFIFLAIGIIQYGVALFAKQELKNNFLVILIAVLALIQFTLFFLISKFKS